MPFAVLTKIKADGGRLWPYVRDYRPFGRPAPPAALFRYSRTRHAEHPFGHLTGYGGILQADAYAGYDALFRGDRSPVPLTRALCWAHARRKFFGLADLAAHLKRREIAAPLVNDVEQWLRSQRALLARHNPVAGAIDYMLKDWTAFTRFLEDGRICLTNNAAERALRGVALGRKAWLFAGSDRGGERAAFMDTLIGTAKLNDIDPRAWLANVLARIADIPQNQLHGTAPVELAATRETARGCVAAVLAGCLLRSRSRIEIVSGRLKDWHGVATRYDRCPTVFLSAIALAATVIFWL